MGGPGAEGESDAGVEDEVGEGEPREAREEDERRESGECWEGYVMGRDEVDDMFFCCLSKVCMMGRKHSREALVFCLFLPVLFSFTLQGGYRKTSSRQERGASMVFGARRVGRLLRGSAYQGPL